MPLEEHQFTTALSRSTKAFEEGRKMLLRLEMGALSVDASIERSKRAIHVTHAVLERIWTAKPRSL